MEIYRQSPIFFGRDENVSKMAVDGRRPTSTNRKPQSGRRRTVENVSGRRQPVENVSRKRGRWSTFQG